MKSLAGLWLLAATLIVAGCGSGRPTSPTTPLDAYTWLYGDWRGSITVYWESGSGQDSLTMAFRENAGAAPLCSLVVAGSTFPLPGHVRSTCSLDPECAIMEVDSMWVAGRPWPHAVWEVQTYRQPYGTVLAGAASFEGHPELNATFNMIRD